MKRITKELVNFNFSNLDEDIVSDETVIPKDRYDAQKISVMEDIVAEKYYRLGNHLFNLNIKKTAELAWKKASIFSEKKEFLEPSEQLYQNLKRLRLQTIGSILIVILCLYVIIFSFFEREPEIFQFTKLRSSSVEILLWDQWWDQWWDTGRPVKNRLSRSLGADELWPFLKQKFKNLFEIDREIPADDIKEKLNRWLELARSTNFKGGPTDYYALIGKGLFESREYDEALSTLKEGLYYAESPKQMEKFYQDLGTVHYYKGYKLQPNGLAKYVLKDVLNSIKSYENALRYGEDPYLYGNLGWGYYLLGDYVSSVENSLKALAMKQDLNYVRMNLGIAYIKKGSYQRAYDAYESILKYSPEHDEYEGGIRDLMEMQQESPGVYPFSNFVLAQLYKQQGRNMKANELLQKFLRQNFPVSYWPNKARSMLKKMDSE